MGIHFCIGKYKAEINNCILIENFCGIFIGHLALGNISCNTNRMSTNCLEDLLNDNEIGCNVVLDGNPFPRNGTTSVNGIKAIQTQLISYTKNYARTAIHLQRTLKAVGSTEHSLCCNKCKVKESEDKKFLKCGRCEGVVYCSKECQKNDWAEHKAVCKVNPRKMFG
jgi:hypothetical protein